jgi:hypothetical protein
MTPEQTADQNRQQSPRTTTNSASRSLRQSGTGALVDAPMTAVRGPANLATPTRNVSVVRANAPTNEIFADTAYDDRVLSQQNSTPSLGRKKTTKRVQEKYEELKAETYSQYKEGTRQRLIGKSLPTPLGSAKTVVARTRVTAINAGLVWWIGAGWLFVQLPLAVVSIALLGLVGVTSEAPDPSGETSWLTSIANLAVGVLNSAVELFTGTELTEIFTSLYMIITVGLFGLGIFLLLFLNLFYMINSIHPLSGKAASLKIGLFLLTVIGLCVPFLNLFPLVLLWMFAIWFYPR